MSLDPNFEDMIGVMVDMEKEVGEGLVGDKQRKWFDFRNRFVVDKFDFDGIHTLFDREKGNLDYVQARESEEALVKDVQTAKVSVDYLAACERDFRMRHRSRIRCFVHGGSRTAANGTDKGPLRVHSLGWLTSVLKEEMQEPT